MVVWLFSVCVCAPCAAGSCLLGLMASIWVIFPLVPKEEEDPGRFPSLVDRADTHTLTQTYTITNIHKINKQTKHRPHTFMYTCTFVNGGWTSLSVDSYRTTSNSKSKPHISPSSCTVYYTAFPFCSAAQCLSFRLNTFKTMITKLSLWVKNSRVLR